MANNTTLPGTGETVEDLDIGAGVKRQVVSVSPRDLSTDDSIGSLTEAAPGTDTAKSGLNGRLVRIAQRLTAMITLWGAATDAKNAATDATSLTFMQVFKQISASIQAAAASLAAGISISNANTNFEVAGTSGTASHQGAPTVNLDPYSQGKAAPASATTVMGATGAQYDYLAGILIIPTSTSPGAVSFTDGNGAAQTIFAGGASSVGDLRSFMVPLGIYALIATTPGFRITCGAGVSAFGVGKLT